jgi:hypothetical protein
LAAVCGLGAGCGSGRPARAEVRLPITRPAASPATPIDASLLARSTGRGTYDTSEHPEPLIAVREVPPVGATWWVRHYRGLSGLLAEREEKLTIDPEGNLALIEEIDRVEHVEVVYTPALVTIPDKLASGSAGRNGFVQDLRMVVHPLGDRTRVKAHGAAHSEIVFSGDEDLTTPAGAFTTHKLVATLTCDLSIARTVNTSERWWADGVGLVCERDREITRVMGATIRNNATVLVLRSFEKGR